MSFLLNDFILGTLKKKKKNPLGLGTPEKQKEEKRKVFNIYIYISSISVVMHQICYSARPSTYLKKIKK